MSKLLRLAQHPASAPFALAALPLLVFGRFVLGDELANADVFLAYRPAHAWLAAGLREGRIPLWNRDLLGGFPLAFTEYGWFSPLNWLPLAAFGGHAGYYVAVALYVALAALATYLLALRAGASRPAATLAGAVYGFSPFVVAGTPLLNQGAAYWALPAGLWLVDRQLNGWRPAAPLLGVLVALTLLGSHPQLSIIVLTPPALYALGACVLRRRWGALLALGVAGGLGALASAVRFLPTLPLIAASERSGGLALGASAIGSVAPHALLAGLVLPNLQIPRLVTPQWTAYTGVLPLVLAGVALARGWRRGAGDDPKTRATRTRSRWLGALGLTGAVLALGTYTPLFWLVQRTPLLAYFREPSRFLLWTILAIALLGAAGLDLLAREGVPTRRGRKAIAGAAAVILAFCAATVVLRAVESRALAWLYLNGVRQVTVRDFPQEHYAALATGIWHTVERSFNPLAPGTFVALLSVAGAAVWWHAARGGARSRAAALLCAVVPLLAFDLWRLPAIPRAVVQEQVNSGQAGATGLTGSLPLTQAESDVSPAARTLSWLPLSADFENRVRLEGMERSGDIPSYRLLRRMAAPNFGVLLGAPQLDGYENLMTREQALLTEALGSERTGAGSALALTRERLLERRRLIGQRWGLIEAAGVGLVLSIERVQPQTWPISVRYEPGRPALDDVPSVNTFRLLRPLPRAFVADDWLVATSAEQAAEMLIFRAEADGAPNAVVTVPEGSTAASVAPPGVPRPAARASTVRLISDEERLVELEVTADRDALLVLLDANVPGWRVTVSGTHADILNANVAFRGVQVPAGTHRVRFEYVPPSWTGALAITTAATLVLLVWLALASRAGGGAPVRVASADRSTSEPPAAG